MGDSHEDKTKPHMTDPPQFVSLDTLSTFGVNYWKVDAENIEKCEVLKTVRQERHYDWGDQVTCSREVMPDYDAKIKMWYVEHIHPDDETRLVLDGSGYFDIRDPTNDKWIRIEASKNDMISIPPGLYHRFTLDEKNYIKANRYFSGVPVWTAHNRPQEDNPVRIDYLKKYGAQS
jgi:1,2-dihydroxy-3-keto-5-methylthiopentene dioxygenase